MDIFFLTIISGLAAGFVIEFATAILPKRLPTWLIRGVFVLPSTYAAAYFLGISTPVIWVVSPAAAFLTLAVLRWLNKPVTIQNIRR